MGKIYNCLAKEIMTAMKAGEKDKANALKNLKAKLLEFKTSVEGARVVNANNGEIPDANELTVIKKYVKELQGDIEVYKTAKPEMSKAAEIEMNYFTVYLPAEATEADIRKVIDSQIDADAGIEQKQMGLLIKAVKTALPNADGKMVSDIVKTYIKK